MRISASQFERHAGHALHHIVDVLIEERAPRLAGSPLWPLFGPILRAFLNYRKAREMADAIAPLSGIDALAHVSKLLRLKVHAQALDRVPREGPCILVANHPTGIADGIAVYDVVHSVRPDICFFANADALRVSPGLNDLLIPVEWPPEKRTLQSTKLTLRMARQALDQERAVVIFPAGAIAKRINGVIQDPDWEHSAVALARKHSVVICPLHVAGPFPFLFHLFGMFSKELRDITLFHELLNKAEGEYSLTFGMPIDPHSLQGESEAITMRLKAYVEQVLPHSPDARLTDH
jgi:putative hemolysin